jgi:hypothetical protein
MTPLVTIGIPCYNAALTLKAAVESALAQTWPRCEIIVVDDGSDDTSAVIAAAFDERVKVLQTGRRGANHARNVILAEARGEWVQYLDADDLLEPQKIARQFEETDGGENADVIYSPVWIETTTSGSGKTAQRERSDMSPTLDLYSQWLAWHLPQTGGCLWRRSALQELTGWKEDQPCCQENELYLRALREGVRWKYAPTPGAIYRIWSEGTLCRKDPALVIKVKTHLIDQLKRWMESKGIWKEVHAAIAGRACFEMSRTLAKSDLRAASRYHNDRKQAGLIRLEGPAAPPSYRTIYQFAGFQVAERLASILR